MSSFLTLRQWGRFTERCQTATTFRELLISFCWLIKNQEALACAASLMLLTFDFQPTLPIPDMSRQTTNKLPITISTEARSTKRQSIIVGLPFPIP